MWLECVHKIKVGCANIFLKINYTNKIIKNIFYLYFKKNFKLEGSIASKLSLKYLDIIATKFFVAQLTFYCNNSNFIVTTHINYCNDFDVIRIILLL